MIGTPAANRPAACHRGRLGGTRRPAGQRLDGWQLVFRFSPARPGRDCRAAPSIGGEVDRPGTARPRAWTAAACYVDLPRGAGPARRCRAGRGRIVPDRPAGSSGPGGCSRVIWAATTMESTLRPRATRHWFVRERSHSSGGSDAPPEPAADRRRLRGPGYVEARAPGTPRGGYRSSGGRIAGRCARRVVGPIWTSAPEGRPIGGRARARVPYRGRRPRHRLRPRRAFRAADTSTMRQTAWPRAARRCPAGPRRRRTGRDTAPSAPRQPTTRRRKHEGLGGPCQAASAGPGPRARARARGQNEPEPHAARRVATGLVVPSHVSSQRTA